MEHGLIYAVTSNNVQAVFQFFLYAATSDLTSCACRCVQIHPLTGLVISHTWRGHSLVPPRAVVNTTIYSVNSIVQLHVPPLPTELKPGTHFSGWLD